MIPDPACQHDWRRNPFVMLPSNPPLSVYVCSKCGAQRNGRPKATTPDPYDVNTWPPGTPE